MKDCYEIFTERFRAASKEAREMCKIYWVKCHRVMLESGKQEMISFTAQILARIMLVESDERKAAA